jgi:hypothetical protein
MSITGDVNELNNLNLEIKRLNFQLKSLRKNAKDCEQRIVKYLQEKDTSGVRYQGKAIILETKTKINKKTKTERENDLIRVLSNHGVANPETAVLDIINSYKGNVSETQKLKIKKLQN